MPEQSFDPLYASTLLLGDLAVYLLGKDNQDVKDAQEKSVQTQTLLLVRDRLLQTSVPDVNQRNKVLFDSIKSIPDMKTALDTDFPGRVTDEMIKDARSFINDGKGLGKSNPAVPGIGILLKRYLDKDIAQGLLCVQTGLRMSVLLKTDYAEARPNQKFDGEILFKASNDFNFLRETRINPTEGKKFPSKPEDQEPYLNSANAVIVSGVELISKKYFAEAALLYAQFQQGSIRVVFPASASSSYKAALQSPKP
jgi:hypothetical protein